MKTIFPFLVLILISCKNVQGITNTVEKINKCYEGSNQIEVDTKVIYNSNNKELTFYIGKDYKNSTQKWEIPMSKINASNIIYEDIEFPYLKIKTTKNKDIKYYENEILNDSLTQFVYPIYDYCFSKKEVKELILNLQKETKN